MNRFSHNVWHYCHGIWLFACVNTRGEYMTTPTWHRIDVANMGVSTGIRNAEPAD